MSCILQNGPHGCDDIVRVHGCTVSESSNVRYECSNGPIGAVGQTFRLALATPGHVIVQHSAGLDMSSSSDITRQNSYLGGSFRPSTAEPVCLGASDKVKDAIELQDVDILSATTIGLQHLAQLLARVGRS